MHIASQELLNLDFSLYSACFCQLAAQKMIVMGVMMVMVMLVTMAMMVMMLSWAVGRRLVPPPSCSDP